MQSQLSAAVDEPRGMQLAAPGSTELHYIPCAALVPFPVITHLLGSPFFREAAAGEDLIATLSRSLEALAAAAPDHLGADGFKVHSSSRACSSVACLHTDYHPVCLSVWAWHRLHVMKPIVEGCFRGPSSVQMMRTELNLGTSLDHSPFTCYHALCMTLVLVQACE